MSITLSGEKAYLKITVSSDTHWAVHQCFKTSYCCSVNFTLTGKKKREFHWSTVKGMKPNLYKKVYKEWINSTKSCHICAKNAIPCPCNTTQS